jgi:peptidoglycan/LPS O-acetylase OafA/YrhL
MQDCHCIIFPLTSRPVRPNRQLEILDALRGGTALYVLIHHYVHLNPALSVFAPIFRFGQLAVMVFFVLSGFVIHYAMAAKKGDLDARTYFIGRFRRIYPIYVLVLLCSWGLVALHYWDISQFHWGEFLGNLFQLQDAPHPGTAVAPYMFNFALWSLAYECWFYVLFFVLHKGFAEQARRQDWIAATISIAGQISYLLYPNALSMYASYFILWWAGLALAREYLASGRVSLARQWPYSAQILVMGLVWWLVERYHIGRLTDFGVTEYPLLQARHFLTVFLVIALGYGWYCLGFPLYRYLLRPFRHFAGISYALYISHLVIFRYIIDLDPFGNVYLNSLLALPAALGIAWLLEQPFQRWVNRWLR